MTRTALLAGSTGLIGTQLLQQLLDEPRYSRVTALSRRALPVQHPRLEVVLSDLDDLSVHADALQADDVYCALGTTIAKAGSRKAFAHVDHDLVMAVARAAHHAGSRRFMLVSAIGSSVKSPAFYSRVKGEVERDLRGVGFEALHILRPSLLMGERSESRPAEQIAQKLAPALGLITRGRLARYAPVSAQQVAAAMIACAFSNQRGVHVHEAPFG
ncbi:NAD(P)H-binding protein [Hydrocarboniphaga sp.]|uniref:NAD(P)H-binding protein n=1 Tax=Hydrocarboniphaga sp. TaxID=2033016 RepID=UPI003D1094CD